MDRWIISGGCDSGEALVLAEHTVCYEKYQLAYGEGVTAAQLVDFIMAHKCEEGMI